MATGRGRDMVKPAWMKEEPRKQVGRRSRSRSPARPRPPGRDGDESGGARERERSKDQYKERDHRERDHRRRDHRERDHREQEDSLRQDRKEDSHRQDRKEDSHRQDRKEDDNRKRNHRERSRSPYRNGSARGRPQKVETNHRGPARKEEGRPEAQPKEDHRMKGPPRKEAPSEQSPKKDHEEAPVDLSLAAMEAAQKALEEKETQKVQPDFGYSGKLAEETNKVNGIALLFTEPPEARKPTRRWRLYVFKGDEPLKDPLYIHRQSCYLFGRERKIADIPTDHPSCSKQHAVIQFRLTEKEGADGMMKSLVVPYIMDLGSTNGTYLNAKRIEAQRYYELLEKDTIKFGNSTREYVLLHENSAGQ